MNVFIYGLVDPRDNRVMYVGKSTVPKARLAGHISESKRGQQSKKNSWLRGLLADGMKPAVRVLEEVAEEDWEEAERKWIAKLEGLTNVYPGGEGTPKGHLKGRKKNPEHAKLLRERLSRHCDNCKGRAQGAEEREKKSIAARKRWGRNSPAPSLGQIQDKIRELGSKASVRKVAEALQCSHAHVRQMPLRRHGLVWEDLKRGITGER